MEFPTTNRYIPMLASWHDSKEIGLSHPVILPVEGRFDVTVDLKIECDGREIAIDQIYEAQPKNGN
ncbi:MAG: hypothetical protein NTU41_11675 [Chloroflexi bacterium]|nr:hypothetical protein [Chloroflexota bacterium]